MATIAFKCPGCGAFVEDDPDKEVLTCARCGATITKEQTEYDKSLKYLREKDIRQEKTEKEEKEYRRKESNKAMWIMIAMLAVMIAFVYLREKGIL